MDAVRPILSANGLVVTQSPSATMDGSPALSTTLLHISGEFISDRAPLAVSGTGAQALGSATTYARRYAYCAILGIVTESDDDGAAGSGQGKRGYDDTKPDADFELILRAVAVDPEPSSFLISLAKQIRDKGSLTDKQRSSGVRAAQVSIENFTDDNEEEF